MKNNICYISDIGHHYREPIFREMINTLDCDFYFSEKKSTIKTIDYKTSRKYNISLKYKSLFGKFYFLSGAIKTSLSYKNIVLLGDPYGTHNWVISALGKLLGKNVYIWTHGLYGKENFFQLNLKIILFKLSKKTLVYGNHSKNLLLQHKFDDKKICVIYNSLDYEKQNAIYLNCKHSTIFADHFGNKNPTVIYIGRIQKIKRLDLLIDLAENLLKKNHRINFVLIGADADASIKKLVIEKNLTEYFWFYGPTYDEETIANLIFNADLCISPGNVGLTAIHSLTYGCPVITHSDPTRQMPEFEAIKPGITGDFFKKDSIEEMSELTLKWIGKSISEREAIKIECHKEISKIWNPKNQISLIRKSIDF